MNAHANRTSVCPARSGESHNRMANSADRVRRCWPLYLALIILAVFPLAFVGAFVLRPYVRGQLR